MKSHPQNRGRKNNFVFFCLIFFLIFTNERTSSKICECLTWAWNITVEWFYHEKRQKTIMNCSINLKPESRHWTHFSYIHIRFFLQWHGYFFCAVLVQFRISSSVAGLDSSVISLRLHSVLSVPPGDSLWQTCILWETADDSFPIDDRAECRQWWRFVALSLQSKPLRSDADLSLRDWETFFFSEESEKST